MSKVGLNGGPRPSSGQAAPVLQDRSSGSQSYSASLRRVPSQQRGREKVVRILDAAEQLLIEIGYEQAVATPALLIDRAKVSGGSFYTYFSNPEAVMEALAFRFMDNARATADALAQQVHQNWREAANRFFAAFVGFYDQPAVRELWLDGHLSRAARQGDEDSNAYLAQRLQMMFAQATVPGPRLRPICYRVAMEIYDYLMRLAFRAPTKKARADLLHEAKSAFLVYLEAANDQAEQ
jgi:AcrR family transcriptional regulator